MNKLVYLVRLISLLLLIFTSNVLAAEDPHNMFQGNPRHSGESGTQAVAHFKEVNYAFKTNGTVRSTPAYADGRIYFGSSDGNCYAIDAGNGKELWRFATGGAVLSSPAVADGIVYFTAKDHIVYAVDEKNGKERWRYSMGEELPYQYGFDNFLSSPTIAGEVLYIGGGDGNLYAFNKDNGSVIWKYFAGSRIRTSPAAWNDIVFAGTLNGFLYAIDKTHGTMKWKYATLGSTLKFEDYGYDRTAILSSPSVADGLVVFGCRDGILYAVDIATGSLKWKYDHKISWVISTPAIADGMVYAGSSDSHFFQCVDLKSGMEKWRFKTKKPVWGSGAIAGSMVYFGEYDGTLYALDRTTGVKRWSYTTGDRIFSSPIVVGAVVYCGSDDGNLYALQGTTSADTATVHVKKAVYWEHTPGYKYFELRTDEWVRDYFKSQGYEIVDGNGLKGLMTDQLTSKARSVVVFADHYFPPSIVEEQSPKALVRRYLDACGKIVLLGPNPLAYLRDSTGQIVGIDFAIPPKVFGINYPGSAYDAIGLYQSTVTDEGKRWGLQGWWVGLGWVEPDQVSTVLARDENGKAGAWVKNYGGPEGTGLVQLYIPTDRHINLFPVMKAAEFGLEK
jgi:eukaryotic-like serine/threonine-protein kinase